MKVYKGICKECGGDKWIGNSKGICPDCIYVRNHNGKTRAEVTKERIKAKPYKISKAKPYIHKNTGERALFDEIWQEREHVCVNCGDFLSESVTVRNYVKYFSHIKSKGAYPELRLDKNNVELLCHTCHDIWEFGDRKDFYKRHNGKKW